MRHAPLLLPLLLLALAAPRPAAAARPSVVVDAPDFQPLPLALPAFQPDGDLRASEEVLAVLRADLRLSGLFELLDPRGFLADPTEGLAAPSIKFGRWASVGAEGLVKARVRREGARLAADLRLHDVRAGREVLQRGLFAPDARALAHHLADELVRHYTGEPGVFRTRLVAVRRAGQARELVLLDADGKNPRVLLSETALLLMPSWHPDGDRILVTSYRGGRPELWVYRLSDRSFRRLPTGHVAMGGAFSPDGARLAFTAADGADTDVWVAAADGSGARRLTTTPALDLSPSWSPDGRRLAFVSDRSGTPQLFVMNADGSSQRRLTFQGNYNQTPQWSPRGDLIAFTARDERKVFDVFVVSPETGKVERVTQDQGRTNEEPTWAPNGRLLAFTSDRGGLPQLVLSDPRGERQAAATSGAELATPAWGPFPRE
ncbi:MAG: PD40 domain-containing protein [Anaeromyxobacter sp.]|nr:PD40 domain-containing protein [Anaeromyxobacter sp.]MBL0275774.1 PD40 domain-containing protein [Anaeromyxobacter sp.]